MVRERHLGSAARRHSHNINDNDLHRVSRMPSPSPDVERAKFSKRFMLRSYRMMSVRWVDFWAWSPLMPAYTSKGVIKCSQCHRGKRNELWTFFFCGSKHCVMPLWHCVGVFMLLYRAFLSFDWPRRVRSCCCCVNETKPLLMPISTAMTGLRGTFKSFAYWMAYDGPLKISTFQGLSSEG